MSSPKMATDSRLEVCIVRGFSFLLVLAQGCTISNLRPALSVLRPIEKA